MRGISKVAARSKTYFKRFSLKVYPQLVVTKILSSFVAADIAKPFENCGPVRPTTTVLFEHGPLQSRLLLL